MTGNTMHIGELAERTGLSLRTLRHYDEIGLVKASGRTEGGFRLYTQSDFERLMLIRRMKPLGYSLEETAELVGLVESETTTPAVVDGLQRFVSETEERRADLQKQLEMADEFLELLRSRLARSSHS
jgi:DNA-binding transcriptional MerR regulator